MTIDLRGIGDAVRAAAAARGMGVAQLVRRALVMSLDLRATAAVVPTERGSDGQTSGLVPTRETQAAREFAKAELANHRYVMVLHTHQANPHVHISVRAEGRDGRRLNPRKEDLHRWRETFAERLRGWGIEAEASSQATRGVSRRSLRGRERQPGAAVRTSKKRGEHKSGPAFRATRSSALQAWAEITKALAASSDPADRKLSKSIVDFVMQTDVARAVQRHRAAQQQAQLPGMTLDRGRTIERVSPERSRGPDMSR